MRSGDYTYSNTVWLIEEQVFGRLVGPMGAYVSMVEYTKAGIDFEVLMENDEFMTMEALFTNDDDSK